MNTERILLVDDSENDNLFHEITIRKTGFTGEIRAFESAEDFLQFLGQDEGGAPTLVLLDINLPGMSGFDCARQLEALVGEDRSVFVSVLTSSTWRDDRQTAEALPLIDEFLIKPLTREALERVMERARAKACAG